MDKILRDILNNLPDKPPRSRLAPYAELIDELFQRGWTYRGVAVAIEEKCGVRVSPSNLHHFVKKAKTKQKTACSFPSSSPSVTNGLSEFSEQITGLKDRQPTKTVISDSEFTFDPTVPLRIKRHGSDEA